MRHRPGVAAGDPAAAHGLGGWVTAASGYHREHLTMVERGTSGVCVDRDLLHAYEKAIGVTATDALLAIVGELLGSLWSAHETLTRLHRPHQTTSTDR